jgi:hypothetical protein
MEALAASLDARDNQLQSMEGRDAILSDHLRRAAGVLWP